MVEGGPKVAASLLRADLVDEAVLLHGPITIGADGVDALDGLALDALTASSICSLSTPEQVGGDSIRTIRAALDVYRHCHRYRRGRELRASGRTGCAALSSPAAMTAPRSRSVPRSPAPGICLTVVETGLKEDRTWFAVDAAAETVALTNVRRWSTGTRINLERSLKIGDELGGHIVTGHVDGVATDQVARGPGRSGAVCLTAPGALARVYRKEGLGRARRGVADGERGRWDRFLGADHSAHPAGHHARRTGSR